MAQSILRKLLLQEPLGRSIAFCATPVPPSDTLVGRGDTLRNTLLRFVSVSEPSRKAGCPMSGGRS